MTFFELSLPFNLEMLAIDLFWPYSGVQNLAEFVSELVAVFKSENLVDLRLESAVDFIGIRNLLLDSSMDLLKKAWEWLSVEKYQKTLGVVFLVIAGGWQAYLHFTEQQKESNPTITVSGNGTTNTGSMAATASQGGNAINVVGNNNTVGVSPALVEQIVSTLTQKKLPPGSQANDSEVKALTEAVKALNTVGTEAQVKAALDTLAKGDTNQAKALFAQAAEKGEQEAKQTAEAYRYLGALAFLDNTQEALQTYRRATELDPDNLDSWNMLGRLLFRDHNFDEALAAFNKAKALGVAQHKPKDVAVVDFNLGFLYQAWGDQDVASNFYQDSLELYISLNDKEGMAMNYTYLGMVNANRHDWVTAIKYFQDALTLNESLGLDVRMTDDYTNLGVIYQTIGDQVKAIEYHRKALELDEKLGDKNRLAIDYYNLGDDYNKQSHKEQAKLAYQKSIDLYKAIGNPTMVKQVQGWLDAL